MKAKSTLLKIGVTFIATIVAIWTIYSIKSTPPTASSRHGVGNAIANRMLLPADVQQIAAGAALYGTHCASCHGTNLEGQPDWKTPHPNGAIKAPPHDDSGHTWHHDDKTLFRYTKLGGRALMAESGIKNFNSGMPGFAETLSDTQIENVLAFIKSRWSKRSQKIQRERSRVAN